MKINVESELPYHSQKLQSLSIWVIQGERSQEKKFMLYDPTIQSSRKCKLIYSERIRYCCLGMRWVVRGQMCQVGVVTKEHEETPGGDGIFIVFIVMMVL